MQIAGAAAVADGLNGGGDSDTLQVVGAAAATLAGFNAATSSIEIWQGNNQGVLGTAAADAFNFFALGTITGLAFVDAGSGNDTIVGSDFADDLRGGAGVDAVNGGLGNDVLQITGAEALNDALNGGGGVDRLKIVGAGGNVTGRLQCRIVLD